ncbi:MAG: 50S ribosomal protein L17 [Elusimicrobiota bacterium]
MKTKEKNKIRNLTFHLIENKRIVTSVPCAKKIKSRVERLISRASKDTTSRRRYAARYLPKKGVKILFDELGPANKERKGGYTRLLRLDNRKGDGRQQCIIEIIDV